MKQESWKELIRNVVTGLPRSFSLADVLQHKQELQTLYPDNRFVEAKIRQTLQVLRDQGLIEFRGAGRYRRLDAPPTFSALLPDEAYPAYHSASQIAKMAIETWAELNLYCVNCSCDSLTKLPENTPVADFLCPSCAGQFQLKGKNGRFGSRVTGAAYKPVITAIKNQSLPHYILVEYDKFRGSVVFVNTVRGDQITEQRVQARNPLRESAKRAGWIGCTIDISGLASVALVEPQPVHRTNARKLWRQAAGWRK